MNGNNGIAPKVITNLKEAVRDAYGCEALFINTVHVEEPLESDPKWDGVVKVFELIGHSRARRCYAWSFRDAGKLRAMTALELAPVTSPEVAISMTNARSAERQPANLEAG